MIMMRYELLDFFVVNSLHFLHEHIYSDYFIFYTKIMFFETTITLTSSRLQALISLIDKVQNQAKENGIDDATILGYSLTSDMFSFARQIQIATDNAKGMASRITGRENPKYEDNETTLDELKARLAKTIAFLETFSEADFANAATAEARFPWFPGMHMVGAGYILTY